MQEELFCIVSWIVVKMWIIIIIIYYLLFIIYYCNLGRFYVKYFITFVVIII